MALLITLAGLVLLGITLGFIAAVTLGMRAEDRGGRYRSLRNEARGGPLARTARRLVGLSIRPDPPRRRAESTAPGHPART